MNRLHSIACPRKLHLPDETARIPAWPLFHLHFLDAPIQMTSTTAQLHAPSFVELVGPVASGKSHILLHVTMATILPRVYTLRRPDTPHHPVEIHGRQQRVCYLDCDGRMDVKRLVLWMQIHVEAQLQTQLSPDCLSPDIVREAVEEIVDESLTRLQLFRPHSSLELVACLRRVAAQEQYRVFPGSLAFLMVDPLTAFHWIDTVELQPSSVLYQPLHDKAQGSTAISSSTSPKQRMMNILRVLEELSKATLCNVLIVRASIFQPKVEATPASSAAQSALPPELLETSDARDKSMYGPRWKELVTHRFNLVRIPHQHQHQHRQHNEESAPTMLLSCLVRPKTNAQFRQQHLSTVMRSEPSAEEVHLWRDFGILPWEIHHHGIA